MPARGFTLLELMISILLFAMISTAAYKLFDSVSRAQTVTDGILDKLDTIQRAEVIIEKDFFQMIDRPIRDEQGEKIESFKAPSRDGFLVEFTRSGWRNPINALRSNLQRVAYNIEGGELIRYYWLMLDRPQEPVRFRQKVLSGVRGLKFRFLDEKRQWRNSWPVSSSLLQPGQTKKQGSGMPLAVEIAMTHEEFGSIMMVVPGITDKKGQDLKKGREDLKQEKQSPGRPQAPRPRFDDEEDEDE